jgi:hypothetical protein
MLQITQVKINSIEEGDDGGEALYVVDCDITQSNYPNTPVVNVTNNFIFGWVREGHLLSLNNPFTDQAQDDIRQLIADTRNQY